MAVGAHAIEREMRHCVRSASQHSSWLTMIQTNLLQIVAVDSLEVAIEFVEDMQKTIPIGHKLVPVCCIVIHIEAYFVPLPYMDNKSSSGRYHPTGRGPSALPPE
jgi:hypothetical protein